MGSTRSNSQNVVVKNKLHRLTRAGVAVDWDGENIPMKFMCRGPSYVSDPDSDDEQDAS